MVLDGEAMAVGAGWAVWIPGIVEHGNRNTGNRLLHFFYAFPVGSFADNKIPLFGSGVRLTLNGEDIIWDPGFRLATIASDTWRCPSRHHRIARRADHPLMGGVDGTMCMTRRRMPHTIVPPARNVPCCTTSVCRGPCCAEVRTGFVNGTVPSPGVHRRVAALARTGRGRHATSTERLFAGDGVGQAELSGLCSDGSTHGEFRGPVAKVAHAIPVAGAMLLPALVRLHYSVSWSCMPKGVR